MIQKMTGVFTAVVAALLMVGVAWAGGDDESTSVTSPSSTIVTIEDTSVPGETGSSTPASVDDSVTSTTVGTVATTSATVGSTPSTTIGDTTSTSFDDTTSTSHDDSDDQRDEATIAPSGRTTHSIPGVGAVTIEVSDGRLVLVSVSAPGWVIEHDKVESDRIEIEFTSGDAEAEFEAELKDHGVEIEIRSKSD